MGHDRDLAKELLSKSIGSLTAEDRLSLIAALSERQAEKARSSFKERIGVPETPSVFDIGSPLDRARLAGTSAFTGVQIGAGLGGDRPEMFLPLSRSEQDLLDRGLLPTFKPSRLGSRTSEFDKAAEAIRGGFGSLATAAELGRVPLVPEALQSISGKVAGTAIRFVGEIPALVPEGMASKLKADDLIRDIAEGKEDASAENSRAVMGHIGIALIDTGVIFSGATFATARGFKAYLASRAGKSAAFKAGLPKQTAEAVGKLDSGAVDDGLKSLAEEAGVGFEFRAARKSTEATQRGAQASTPVQAPPRLQKPATGRPGAETAPFVEPAAGTAARHADIERLRGEFDIIPRKKTVKSDVELLQEVKDRSLVENAVSNARLAKTGNRFLDDAEQLGAAAAIEGRRATFLSAKAALRQAQKKGDVDAAFRAQKDAELIDLEMNELASALDDAGEVIGRAQRARRFVAKIVDDGFTEPEISYRLTKALDGSPTSRQRADVAGQAERIADLEARVAKAEGRAATDAQFVKKLKGQLKSQPARARNRIFTEQSYKAAIKRLNAGGVGRSKVRGGTTIPLDIADRAIVVGFHIEKGVRSLPELVSQVRKVLPGATDADVNLAAQHALDQISKRPRLAGRAMTRTLKNLRAEVKVSLHGDDLVQANRALDDIERTIKDPASGIREMEKPWAELLKLRQKYGQGSSYGFDTLVSGKYGLQTKAVSDLRFRLDRAKVESGAYVQKAKEAEEFSRLSKMGKVWHQTQNVGRELRNIPIQLRVTADMSYTGRQGIWFLANPRYAKASKQMLKRQWDSFKTEKGYQEAEFYIVNHPDFERLSRSGLVFEGGRFGEAQELFRSKILQDIRLWPGGPRPFRANERAYTMAGNVQRLEASSSIIKALERGGKALDPEDVRIVADYANSGTGRGTTRFTKGLQKLSLGNFRLLWAPKLTGGRFEILAGQPLIRASLRAAKTGDYRLVRRIAQDYAIFSSAISSVFALATLGGAKVSGDWNDSDFGKIKIGDFRTDILGGLQQVARFSFTFGEAMWASLRGAPDSEKKFRGAVGIAERFGRSKLAPVPSAAADWLLYEREDYIGEAVTLGSTIRGLTAPLAPEGYVENLVEGDPVDQATFAYILETLGFSSDIYQKRQKASGLSGVSGVSGVSP